MARIVVLIDGYHILRVHHGNNCYIAQSEHAPARTLTSAILVRLPQHDASDEIYCLSNCPMSIPVKCIMFGQLARARTTQAVCVLGSILFWIPPTTFFGHIHIAMCPPAKPLYYPTGVHE